MRKELYAATILGLVWMSIGCQMPAGDKVVAKPVETAANVARKDLEGFVYFDGKVFVPANAQGTAYAPDTLTVGEVSTSVGKRVSKGQTLATLTMPAATANLSAAESNYRSSQAAYQAAVAANGSSVSEARATLREAREAERLARAAAQSGASTDLTAVTETRIVAEQNLRLAQADLDSKTLAEREAVAIAYEYLKDARSGANVARVRSPITGTVISFDAKPGMQVKAMQALATIADLGKIEVHGTFAAEHADVVKVGVPVVISLEGPDANPFDGRVREVSILPPAEGQRAAGYLAVIGFDNSKGVVLPGAKIKRIGVRTGKAKDVLVVPVGALAKGEDGKPIVYTMKGDTWLAVPVEVGISDGALVEIRKGLFDGDVVRVITPGVTK